MQSFITARFSRGLHSFALMLLGCSCAHADLYDAIQFRGFGTLSAAYSDSDTLGFRRDATQHGKIQQWSLAQDSAFGLQADMTVSDSIKASVQLVAKDRSSNKALDSVEWAYISYEPSNKWRFRLGRIGTDVTMIGDVANVGYAYDWVRPPVDFYAAIPFYHFDGVEVVNRSYVAAGQLSTKVFYGKSDGKFASSTAYSEFDLSPFCGTAFLYERGAFTFRAAYLYANVTNSKSTTNALLADMLSVYAGYPDIDDTIAALDYEQRAHYVSSGIGYRFGQWNVLAESMYLDSDEALYLSYFSAYTGVVRRFDKFAVFGLLAHTRSLHATYKVSATVPEPLRSYAQKVFSSVAARQSTISLGTRWDVTSNVALKLQWDHSWVTENSAAIWSLNEEDVAATPDTQVNVFTLSMSFVF